jgi:hypothetical protein
MKKTPDSLVPKSTASKGKVVVICTLIVMIVCLFVVGLNMLSRAKARAERITAIGRLSQMRLALEIYEGDHGTLPPLYLRDDLGIPIQSWRALILPQLGLGNSTQLNLSQPWNSDHNRHIINSVPSQFWVRFALRTEQMTSPASTHILAYLGRESIWDAKTGLPKGKTTEHPNAIMLIWIPRGHLHPLQPGDITEEEVRERVAKGHEVLFSAAGDRGRYGNVTIEQGELAFHGREGRRDE